MVNKPQNILVLGSSGLIGSAMVKHLEAKGHNVTSYDIRRSLSEDLTNSNMNHQLRDAIWKADFVYFFAFDVGGSKYLGSSEKDFQFIHNNTRIMENVFDALSLCKTPFIFASSMMSNMTHSTYGKLKSLGESYTLSLMEGIVVRYWNVYGFEEVSEKSHVVPDFCWQALQEKQITMLTKGEEQRQFIHVNDAVEATDLLRETRGALLTSSALPVFDISNGEWISIKTLAEAVSKEFGGVPVVEGNEPDYVQRGELVEPNLQRISSNPWKWKCRRSLEQGIKLVAKECRKEENAK